MHQMDALDTWIFALIERTYELLDSMWFSGKLNYKQTYPRVWTAGRRLFHKVYFSKPYPEDETQNEVMSYTHWQPRKPYFGDCVALKYNPDVKLEDEGKWEDRSCNKRHGFLCEIDK